MKIYSYVRLIKLNRFTQTSYSPVVVTMNCCVTLNKYESGSNKCIASGISREVCKSDNEECV